MNKKIILAIAAILLIATASIFFINKNRDGADYGTGEQQDSCASAPAEYKAQCEQMNAKLDQLIADWKPSEYKPMEFGAYILPAAYIGSVSDSLTYDFIDATEETGIDMAVIYTDGTQWLDNDNNTISRWNAFVDKIKNDGKKVYVAYFPMASKFSRTDESEAWNDYKTSELTVIRGIFSKQKPDYFTVLNEPSTVQRFLKFQVSEQQWTELVEEAANLVRQLSPNTTTVIHVTGGDLGYLDSFVKVKNLDRISFNIYGIKYLDTVSPYVENVKKSGKRVAVGETWIMWKDNWKYPWMEPLYGKWLNVMTYFAQRNGMESIFPYFTAYFYVFPTGEANESDLSVMIDQLENALDDGERRQSFYAYKLIIEEVRNNAK